LEFNELLKKRLNGGKFDTEKQRHNLLGNHFSLFLFFFYFFHSKVYWLTRWDTDTGNLDRLHVCFTQWKHTFSH